MTTAPIPPAAAPETPEVPAALTGIAAQEEAFTQMKAHLPEAVAGDPNIAKHKTFESLAKDYANALPMLGRKGVILPSEEPKDIARFLTELGRPETATGYDRAQFTPPEGLPWDTDLEAGLTQLMHDSGVTQAQYEKLINGYAALQQGHFQKLVGESGASHAAAEQALKVELGGTYDRTINMADRAVAKIFGEGGAALLQSRLPDGSVLGNNMDFVRGMIEVSKLIGEDSLVTDGQGLGIPMGKTPDEAKAEIKAKEADPEFQKVYLDRKHPGHAAANAEMDALYAQAHPPK